MNQEYTEHGLVNSRCNKCVFRSTLGNISEPYCDYLAQQHQMRPCPAGKHCTEFVEGTPSSQRKTLVVKKKKMIICKYCGKEFAGDQKQKVCPECNKARHAEIMRSYVVNRIEKRKAKEMSYVKHCYICGAEYHSDTKRRRLCDECFAKIRKGHKGYMVHADN